MAGCEIECWWTVVGVPGNELEEAGTDPAVVGPTAAAVVIPLTPTKLI